MSQHRLVILGYSQAAMYCRTNPPPVAVVSIHGQREFGVELSGVPRLDLHCDDVDAPPADDPVAAYFVNVRRRWHEQNGLIEVSPYAR